MIKTGQKDEERRSCQYIESGVFFPNRHNFLLLSKTTGLDSGNWEHRNLLAEKLHIDCAPGKITIRPRRNEYYDFIEENKQAIISIDCGTAETYCAVKGADAFEQVVSNLQEYRRNSNQLILKYILLDANCNKRDVLGFITLCKNLNITKIDISADLFRKTDYMNAIVPEEHIVNSAVELICEAVKSRIKFSIYRKEFGEANLAEICRRLLDSPEFVLDMKKFDSVFSSQRLICYGAGNNAGVMLKHMKQLEMREPDIFWDIKADENDACKKIADLGYMVSYPRLGL